jgi:hypothetical protein
MLLPLPRLRAATWLAALAFTLAAAGCAEPPQKELDQAQAAIEVAVSAGAERFATDALNGARTALIQARDAVSQRDYKLALSHALDSRERAQVATRAAGEARAALAREVDGSLTEVTAVLDRVRTRLADGGGIPRARLRRARAAETKLTASLQEARAAVTAQDFPKAQAALARLKSDVDALQAELDGAPSAQSSRGRR